VPASPIFIFQEGWHASLGNPLLRRLPPLSGLPVRIRPAEGLRDRHGPVHAGTFLRERCIRFDCTRAEFPRILVHELFHFVWLRAGNPLRWEFEDLLVAEHRAGASGELGWSAEWRKAALIPRDTRRRSRRWRDYCCESFCDTAAWMYSGIRRHEEFTLGTLFRQRRRVWFRKRIETKRLSI
jgi:hypothetical protein